MTTNEPGRNPVHGTWIPDSLIAKMETDKERLEAENARLRAALEAVEWMNDMNLRISILKLKRRKAWEELISYCESVDKVAAEYKAAAYKEFERKENKIERKIVKAGKP